MSILISAVLVVSISDGDTVTVLTEDKQQQRVRLLNIDTPERKQYYGGMAKRDLSALVGNQRVDLHCKSQAQAPASDRYGRWLCTLWKDGVDVNLELVANGSAWVYRKYYDGTAGYLEAEEEARNTRQGLWAQDNPIPPWEYRKAH